MLTFAEILQRFGPHTRRGKDYRVRCPVHGDTTPSLDIAEGDTGIVFFCRSKGCHPRDILAAKGLTWADVLPARTTNGHGQDIYYDYRDAAGLTTYRKVRITPKDFYLQHPNGSGGWEKGLAGAAALPYRLPELAGHARVWIPEGEKDVDRLWSINLPATCNVHGAKKWRDSDSAHLKAAGVQRAILLTDNDGDGRDHVKLVAASLEKVGITSLTLPPFAGLPVKGDVSDWLDLGHTKDELEALVIAQTPAPILPALMTARALCALPDPAASDALLGALIVRGQRHLIGGHTGRGKTTFIFNIIKALLTGTPFLGFTPITQTLRLLVIDAEQGIRTIKRRLREAHLDTRDDLTFLCVPGGLTLDQSAPERDALQAYLKDGQFDLVVASPLYKLHAGDSNEERAAVDLMKQFDRWRDVYGFASVFEMHCRKPPPVGGKLTMHDFFGSGAYLRGAEIVLGIDLLHPGISRLYFFKDRDGDLPNGETWDLVFDRAIGFTRGGLQKKQTVLDKVAAVLKDTAPTPMSSAELRAATGGSERAVRDALKKLKPLEHAGAYNTVLFSLAPVDEATDAPDEEF